MASAPQTPGPAAIVGTTTWGTTLAVILARRGIDVRLLARTGEEAARLSEAREHPHLAGHMFPESLRVTGDWAAGLDGASVVLFAVPAQTMRENAKRAAPHIGGSPVVVSAAKGLEHDTFKRMSQVLDEELPSTAGAHCALSGPNLAREVVRGLPTSTVVAGPDPDATRQAQSLLNSTTFRVYTNTDVVGTELAGALKNVIAIGAGVVDGMSLGDNAKAGFLTRGLAEITRLGVAAGADALTFAGNAGLGDLMATCFSTLSRNNRVGIALAQGRSLEEAIAALGGEVAEGVETTPAALDLARAHGVEMPIAELTNRVLFEGLSPKDALGELMARVPRPE
ncbi:MAG: NAD(P)-dependent glycerol-3-phosphate dehydrogenase [Chloroflexi bacterium]|nr:NAD(P)-dependent glycerol-3-phosphate dehydrogenase [Chloroflexota bacterium]